MIKKHTKIFTWMSGPVLLAALFLWEPVWGTGHGNAGSITSARIKKAINRGIEFLLQRQNKNGSWGSPRNTKGLNIYAPVPGAHHAFIAGTTSLCISALIKTKNNSERVKKALDRAEKWMFIHMPKLRRATPDAIYNIWGHAYSLQAFSLMLKRHSNDEKLCLKIKKNMRQQVGLLNRYETVDGGWNYYDFAAHTQKPSGSTPSFLTATVLVELYTTMRIGIKVNNRIVKRAIATLRRERKPDFSYVYSESHKYHPMSPVNRPGGSMGRDQACNLAMLSWGDKSVTEKVLLKWLDQLILRNGWLDMGRKRPIPHESWFQVAGYFFYYGHYYASLCIKQLKPELQAKYKKLVASIIVPLQEKDGSWWDYPLYDYHQQYGTAFALMTLLNCQQ